MMMTIPVRARIKCFQIFKKKNKKTLWLYISMLYLFKFMNKVVCLSCPPKNYVNMFRNNWQVNETQRNLYKTQIHLTFLKISK